MNLNLPLSCRSFRCRFVSLLFQAEANRIKWVPLFSLDSALLQPIKPNCHWPRLRLRLRLDGGRKCCRAAQIGQLLDSAATAGRFIGSRASRREFKAGQQTSAEAEKLKQVAIICQPASRRNESNWIILGLLGCCGTLARFNSERASERANAPARESCHRPTTTTTVS